MSSPDLTIREADRERLRELVLSSGRNEAAAYVLCGQANIVRDPWDHTPRRRLMLHSVKAIPPEDFVSASEVHVTWSTNSYVKLLKQANDEGLLPGIVHSHPKGPAAFSDQDLRNERDLLRLTQNRNGDDAALVSTLLTRGGLVRAQLWTDSSWPAEITDVRIVGKHLAISPPQPEGGRDTDFLARQASLFGEELNARLRAMRVGIVGCGGTGSATAMLLARLGVGRLVLIDKDIVEVSNLGRLHGARRRDADAKRSKVEVLARHLTEFGLGTHVVTRQCWVGDSLAVDALKSCDVIFGCTDDHDGRLLLNRLAHFYLIPVIDMGLVIDPGSDNGYIADLTGRVTVLVPGSPCLLCRRVVVQDKARDESLLRSSPQEYDRRKKEAYVRGVGNPAPAVVTFTTATACLAIDELLRGLDAFQDGSGWVWQRARRFDIDRNRRPGAKLRPDCPLCSSRSSWGRGDVEPFLDRTGSASATSG